MRFIRVRSVPLLGLLVFAITLVILQTTRKRPSWQQLPQVVGLGDFRSDPSEPVTQLLTKPVFVRGHEKPPGSNYTRALVMARTKKEDVSWVDEANLDVTKMIYVADDPNAPLHPPQNRGNEVMIYLTYIIDHYDNLPDISIFMHAHLWAWHNNDILNNDSAEMIRRLSSERVMREGYMNLRCDWLPGCPDWLHPGKIDQNSVKLEEKWMATCWSELFPNEPIPQVLAQPCCGQFALSRDRIRAVELSRYEFYRDWLLRTDLRDTISGRIWEYLWHVVFTGENTFCPDQYGCYCDGYGVCFDGPESFEKWFEVRAHKRDMERELGKLRQGRVHAQTEAEYEGRIGRLNRELDERRWAAMERGRDPRIRAASVGRSWTEGIDGY